MSWNGMIVFLGSHNLETTDHFYRNQLGFELFKEQKLCKIYSVPGGGLIGFCTHIDLIIGEKAPIITFLTDEVDEIYADFIKNGYKITEPPHSNPRFNIYHFFVKDPNGYTVEIQKFLK